MVREIRVMLVEDNPEDVAFTKRVLKFNKLDRDMLIATSGREALRILTKLANEGEILDLILLDINLPDISGIDLLTQIKKDPRLGSIPVVILTGSNEDEDIQKCYDLGAGSYLVKPISNDALMLVIDTLFGP
jgi:two-component system, response regulator